MSLVMPKSPSFSRLRIALVIAAAATLCGCATDGSGGPSLAAAPTAAPASAQPGSAAANRASARVADRAAPEPAEPVTEQQASADCWMHYENGRRSLSLDARAKLVDKCIDDRMHGQAVR
jgi:hypothetical protein